MSTKCYVTSNTGLLNKGVSMVIDCPLFNVELKAIPEVKSFLALFVAELLKRDQMRIEFESSEPIGYTHTIYKFHIALNEGKYIGTRLVLRGTHAIRILFTLPIGYNVNIETPTTEYRPEPDMKPIVLGRKESSNPPRGQVYIDTPIVYAIFGVPSIYTHNWALLVEGDVEDTVYYTIPDLYDLGLVDVKTDFHCVTGWSLRDLVFTGVQVSRIIEDVGPRSSVKWVYVESLDGYTTIIPYDDFNNENSIIALEMNSKPLDILHGYPARLIIPHLYGWKSAKWIKRIVFTSRYIDGYWESLGYHPRGRVDLEERFKEH
ncbi:MAG: molybdopterin-dependent oxidoreductase [Desulfurococcaceae archaeon]